MLRAVRLTPVLAVTVSPPEYRAVAVLAIAVWAGTLQVL
jgi:hypothetical protein